MVLMGEMFAILGLLAGTTVALMVSLRTLHAALRAALVVMVLTCVGVLAVNASDWALPLTIGTLLGFAIAGGYLLALRRREDRSTARVPVSDEVADHRYHAISRLQVTIAVLQEGRLPLLLTGISPLALGMLAQFIFRNTGDSALSVARTSAVLFWFTLICMVISALILAVIMLGPLVLSSVESWYSATLTRDEYVRARHRHDERIVAFFREHDGLA